MADNMYSDFGERREQRNLVLGASIPLVSVITAVFNGRAQISSCIDSVISQDYSKIEHIVMDGGSTDGTLELLREYDSRISLWKSEPDRGIYDAWNKGLGEARGEWICFLGADDELLPEAVSAYMDLAAKNPQAEYLCSRVRWVHPSGYQRLIGDSWKWKEFSRWMCTAHVGSMHRRSLYDRLGVYDIAYRSAADYELLLRARGSLKTAFMPNVTAMMNAGGASDSKAALAEAMHAKIMTGGRNSALASLDYGIAVAKLSLRRMLQSKY